MSSHQVTFHVFLFISIFFIDTMGQCRWKDDALPTVEGGYRGDSTNLKLYSDDTAEGYFDIKCRPGYRLNEEFGARITCLETGEWSQPLPQCIFMGSCSISELFDFIQNADGITVDRSNQFIYSDRADNSRALGGSNITVQCREGYENQGGSLLIQCTQESSWTTFPQCVPIATSPPSSDSRSIRCPFQEEDLKVPNGYFSKTDEILIYSDGTAAGSGMVTCSPGYVPDSISGGLWSCQRGQWSPKPYCIKTGRCALSELKQFTSNPSLTRGMAIVSQKLSTEFGDSDSILVDSSIVFRCIDGYSNTDGFLNVICNEDGQWSPFPSCIPDSNDS